MQDFCPPKLTMDARVGASANTTSVVMQVNETTMLIDSF